MSERSDFPVLIVDDDPDANDVIRSAVADIGLGEVRVSASRADAQKLLSDGFAPKLIFVEINLDGLAGLNFMRLIRSGKSSAEADALIIIMGEALNPELAGRACEVGFEHFVRKPFTADAVQKRVRAILKNPTRFVVGKSYFGPDRRDDSAGQAYEGGERRIARVKPQIRAQAGTSARTPALDAPKQVAAKPDAALNSIAEPPASPEEPKAKPAATKPPNEADTAPAETKAAAAKAEPQAAPKPAAEPAPEIAAAVPPKTRPKPSKEKIEVAGTTAAPEAPDDPGRAEEIATKQEAHAVWLASRGAEGEKADFADADLAGADLSEVNLASANLRGANLQDALLVRTKLVDADLRGADMSGANMGAADLHNARLRHANLKATLMAEVDLRGADLAGANFEGAQMEGVDFKDANLLGAQIGGANMQGANLMQIQIDKAHGDASTILPPGLRIKTDESDS
ncbi:MAG: response regulator [Rhodospirillaceae bacterium]|nr:response regulator [Rhodospirillaceae bacterium]